MNPGDRDAIVKQVAKINDAHGGCTPQMVWDFIKHLGKGYDDPGRELRRLKDKHKPRDGLGPLKTFEDRPGVYWVKRHERAQGLGRWG